MDILGIGPLELVFILIIMLVVMGPERMVTTARAVGRWWRKLFQSAVFQALQRAKTDLTEMSRDLMNETGMPEASIGLGEDIKKASMQNAITNVGKPRNGTPGAKETPEDFGTWQMSTPPNDSAVTPLADEFLDNKITPFGNEEAPEMQETANADEPDETGHETRENA